MGILSKLLGRPAESVHVVEVALSRPSLDKAALARVNLGSGFWAMTPEGVGIVTGCESDLVTVNLCKGDGRNRMTLDEDDKAVIEQYKGPLSAVRRAYLGEIPNRNPDVDDYEAHMAKHGYFKEASR